MAQLHDGCRPAAAPRERPRAIEAFVQYKMGKIPNYRLRCTVFSYLMQVDDFEVQIERYWDRSEGKISAWCLAQKRPDDTHIYIGTSGCPRSSTGRRWASTP